MNDIDWQDLLFAFDGRINRAKYWLGSAAIFVAFWVVGGILGIILLQISSALAYITWFALSVGGTWAGLALTIKRWHDRDKSGWWILIAWVPLIGWLWALIETGFLPGTAGDNEYGPDPLAP